MVPPRPESSPAAVQFLILESNQPTSSPIPWPTLQPQSPANCTDQALFRTPSHAPPPPPRLHVLPGLSLFPQLGSSVQPTAMHNRRPVLTKMSGASGGVLGRTLCIHLTFSSFLLLSRFFKQLPSSRNLKHWSVEAGWGRLRLSW